MAEWAIEYRRWWWFYEYRIHRIDGELESGYYEYNVAFTKADALRCAKKRIAKIERIDEWERVEI